MDPGVLGVGERTHSGGGRRLVQVLTRGEAQGKSIYCYVE